MLHNIAFGTTYLSTWPNKVFFRLFYFMQYRVLFRVLAKYTVITWCIISNLVLHTLYGIPPLKSPNYNENLAITLNWKTKKRKNYHKRTDTATRIIEFSVMHYPCQIRIWCSKKYFVWLSITAILQKSNILNVNCVNATNFRGSLIHLKCNNFISN